MATVNVGAALAQAGKRVLLVDFDLEAPSLSSFNLKVSESCQCGLVEYVSDYLSTERAPDVSNYISAQQAFPSGGALWIMPAGAPTDDYHTRLAAINWLDLYDNRSGFLLMEEMKAQWKEKFIPDYVLIDSRTGHSDVSGICTRQLPDAVCFLFAPNHQTLDGLATTVQQVRTGGPSTEAKSIRTFFVESNVPYYDDERKTLEKHRKLFLERLKIRRFDATLHQYPHLSLLDRSVFVQEFPDTSLACEYRSLAETLRRDNLEDRDAVLPQLKKIASQLQMPWGTDIFDETRRIDEISERHGSDPEICFWLGRISGALGEFEEAMIQLNRAIDGNCRQAECYIERANLKLKEEIAEGRKEAGDDLRAALVLLAEKPRYSDVLYAVRLLFSIMSDVGDEPAPILAIQSLPANEQIHLAQEISASAQTIGLAYRILHSLQAGGCLKPELLAPWRIAFSLSCIYLKKFKEAIDILSEVEESPRDEQCRLFNRGIALWAEGFQPPKEDFAKILEIDKQSLKESRDPNYLQCLAIASYVTGDPESAIGMLDRARRLAERSVRSHFSAWRYCKVPPPEFMADCVAMREQMEANQNLSIPAIQTDLSTMRTH